MPRFFSYDDHVYLLAPMRPVPGKPGDLGVYRLSGPAQLRRLCVFDAHRATAQKPDPALALPEIAALKRAARPMMPTGRLCAAEGEDARTLADQAAWRPWLLDRPRSGSAISGEKVALYLHNRALTGPEAARRHRAYIAARSAAIAALAPFYRREFGRSEAKSRHLAGVYLDRLIADGFELDPDDEASTVLLAPDYAEKHSLQRAALDGDTAAVKAALGPEPKAHRQGRPGRPRRAAGRRRARTRRDLAGAARTRARSG